MISRHIYGYDEQTPGILYTSAAEPTFINSPLAHHSGSAPYRRCIETKEGQLWLEDQTAGRCAKDGLLSGQWPWDHWIYGRRNGKMWRMSTWGVSLHKQLPNISERPGNRPQRFHHVFIMFYDHSVFRLVEILAFATCLHSWWFLLAFHFRWGLWQILLLLQWEFKNACSTPPKNVTFFGWFCVSPQRQHFFSLHTNLRTVLAVMSQTSAFLWMYCHRQALTYVLTIGLWVDRLYSKKWYWEVLCIAGNRFVQNLVVQTSIWQHLFTGLPASIYCSSMGKHLWAASLDTAHSLCAT